MPATGVTANQKKSFDVGTRLIRAEAAYGVVVSGTGSEFEYPMNDRDRRESLTHLTITENQADIIAGMDAVYDTVSIALPIHPDKDATAATVSTVYAAGDLVWGEAYGPDAANKSWVFIQEGAFKVNRLLVDNTLAEIIALVTP